MSDDIVKRLRRHMPMGMDEIVAANEIERLRAELAAAKSMYDAAIAVGRVNSEDMESLRAELAAAKQTNQVQNEFLQEQIAELVAANARAERHADALRLVSDQCGEYQRAIADLTLERDALIKALAKIKPVNGGGDDSE